MSIARSGIDESKQLITVWADSIIKSAKQLMFDGKAYLIAVSGLPWYRRCGDVWVDESWWIETARSRYERYRSLPDRWIIDELEILTRHFPLEYCAEARLRIEQWYEEFAHDPESWWNVAMNVYPEHLLFQDLYESPENFSEWAILANLGYEDAISALRDELLGEFEEQEYFWVSDILSRIASVGGTSLVKAVISENKLQQIKQSFKTLADRDLSSGLLSSEQTVAEELGQSDCLRVAVQMKWQDVIDSLSENQSYLRDLGIYDILWWSLTNKKQLVENFIVQASPHISRPDSLSDVRSEAMALAVAWKRAMSIE